MPQTASGQTTRGILLVVIIAIVLGAIFYIFPPWQVATDAPDKTLHNSTSNLPVALMWIGSAILAIALIYGMRRARHRSKAEKHMTDDGTKRLYREENDKERGST